jgi:hypothetical protein
MPRGQRADSDLTLTRAGGLPSARHRRTQLNTAIEGNLAPAESGAV